MSDNNSHNGKTKYAASVCAADIDIGKSASLFLQSDFWANFKSRFGWKPFFFKVEFITQVESTPLPLLVLYRRLGPGTGFAYIPWGPALPLEYKDQAQGGATAEVAAALKNLLPRDTAFIRFDLPWILDAADFNREQLSLQRILPKPFTRAAADVQAPDTVLVDLIQPIEAIRANMKSKWRYNIGLAEKKGVVVQCYNDISHNNTEIESFYRIYKETAQRDRIAIHPLEYYTALFQEAAKHNVDTRLYIASHDGEKLAGIITLFRGKEAVYLYGASSNHKRNLMAPYALQWQAIKDAKEAGCHYYDLFGIPPLPPEELPKHPMAGLYRFKTGFIGDESATDNNSGIIHRPGCWDYPCRPLVTKLYSIAEKTRKKIWDLKKRMRYT